MGILRAAVDFLLMRDMPAARVDRLAAANLDRVAGVELEQRAALGMTVIGHQSGRPQYPKRSPVVYDEQAYQKIGLIFRCVNVLAAAIASAPLRVYQEQDQQLQELPKHPVRQLISRPNPRQGELMFKATVATVMTVMGFCVIEKERSAAGRVVALHPLHSEWIMPIPRDQAAPDWEYRIPGNPKTVLAAEDVIVVTFADTGQMRETGIGALEVALREWGLLNTMQDFVKGFFDSGGLPVYGLMLDDDEPLTKAEQQLLQELWVERTAIRPGQQQYPPIMKSIKDIKRLSFDYNELAYQGLRNISEIAICQAFGISPSYANQLFGIEHNTYSNMKEARQGFYEDTVSPLWDRLDDVFTRGLLHEFEEDPDRDGISIEFDKSKIAALQEDQTAKRAHMLEAMKAGGVKRSDYRRAAGLPVDPGDEVYLMPFNVVEVPVSGAGKRSATIAVHSMTRALPAGRMDRRARGLVSMETRDAIERRANRLYSHTATRYGPKVYRYFQEQKARVLGALDSRSAVSAIETRDIGTLLGLDWILEGDLLDPLIRQLWNLMGEQAAGDASDVLAMDPEDAVEWDLANPWAQDVMSRVGDRIVGITETTRQDIARIVNDALAQGQSIDELAGRLEGLYDETYAGRSTTIARTESMVAYNYSTVASFEASGLLTEAEIADNPNHDTEPGSDGLTCAERNGLVVPLADVGKHIAAEHPNGSMAILPGPLNLGEE